MKVVNQPLRLVAGSARRMGAEPVNSTSNTLNRWTSSDYAVCVLIVALGALQFVFSRRAEDYLHDTNYFELFRSIVNHTGYGFNYKPMTQLPPGLPYLLAWLSYVTGSGYTTMVRVMTVFTTLSLLTSYVLLRSRQDRGMAAVTCLLFGSAPVVFAFSTTMVFADMPYFFCSMLLLCMAISLDEAKTWGWRQTLLWLAWGALLAATVLLKSVGIALLGGFMCWIAVSCLKDWTAGRRHLKIFLPTVILAAAPEMGWMSWAAKHQFHEWTLPGYQEHYVAQLRLKNDNEPELGLATWKDVLVRPIAMADDTAAAMIGLFTHKQMAPAWYSPGTVLPLLLIVLGLAHSIWRTGGGLLEWYFICYQMMFLFWPWDFELRFLFPVAPLAFLYAWRAIRLAWALARKRPELLGRCGVAIGMTGCLSSILWGRDVLHPQMRWCVAVWVLVTGVSLGLLWFGPNPMGRLASFMRSPISLAGRTRGVGQWLLAAAVGLVFVTGVGSQLRIGAANLDTDLSKDDFNYPEIEAAQWIKAHSEPSTVVMARKDDMVYHYSQRRVIWFPASRDAATLMDGIRRYHVRYIVVHYGNDTYWRPPAAECFESLHKAYPGSFRRVHVGPHNSVFEVSGGLPSTPYFKSSSSERRSAKRADVTGAALTAPVHRFVRHG